MVRKIPENLENPIDNLIYKDIDKVSSLFKKYNFTPNMLTSISAFFGLISIYAISKDKFLSAGIFYFISYYFDCLDGYFARKYDMVTKFGDYYDHVKDIVILFGLVYVLIYKKLYSGLIFLLPFFFLMLVHFGCQEVYYDKDESDSLNFTKCLCPTKDITKVEKILTFTRYFGCGTMVLLFCIYIISFQFRKTESRF